MSEAFSRVKIDEQLKESGWDLLNQKQVRLELNDAVGRADYVLMDEYGHPLCVLEAKREDYDPYLAKDQARGYARNLNAPFVILSNGKDHWFWNIARADERDAYRIQRFPSPDDLKRMKIRNVQPPRPLLTEKLGPDYLKPYKPDVTLRGYQIKAIDEVSMQFDEQGKRSFLLEMATGTGKTLLCAAMIRRFLKTRNAERVLFIVDRIELAKQTREDFDVVLQEYKPVTFKTARRRPGELLGSCVVVATIQSLLVNSRYRTEFSPFHFDLVINDEAHRSIYGDAREVVLYFQATRLGLTATPKAYLANVDVEALGDDNPKALEARVLRDTYLYFGCQPGFPTYRYDMVDAANDKEGPFLCLPKIIDIRTDVTTKALADGGWAVTIDEREENYKISDLERKVFTPARNRVMCEALLNRAQHEPSGRLGKTIIFAVNQRHAASLTKILNEIQPEIAVTITSHVKDASAIAKEFRDGNRKERIAVSVDMLSTGYNCRDLLNIALMRPVFSPTEYVQIKGRGTRLYTFDLGNSSYKKENYFILDFCAVAEYFEETYDYTEPLPLPGIRGEGAPEKDAGKIPGTAGPPKLPLPPIPIWKGFDRVISEVLKIVGPKGEKVDSMTFRGNFERDLKVYAETDADLVEAVHSEDDDAIEEIMNERFFHKPVMYYSEDKLILAYDVPAPAPAFVYKALANKPLPTKDQLADETSDSIAARFNLRYAEHQIISALTRLVASDQNALERFNENDITLFGTTQFNQLGGVDALLKFENRDDVFEALRQSALVRQSLKGANLN